MLFDRKNKKEFKEGTIVAVFDIASASVGGLLFRYHKKGLPEVLASTRQPAVFPAESSFPAIWRSLHKAFLSVAEFLKKSVPEKPDYAFCIFSSPWYVSQTKLVRVTRKESFVVDKPFLSNLIRDEAEIFKRRWQEFILGEKGESFFLEQEPVKTTLNGYLVKSPEGKTAHKMEMAAYFSMGLDAMEEKIKDDTARFIGHRPIFFHTFPFVVFKTLRHMLNTTEGLILADITGELTDVFLIRDDVIEEVNSFGKGANFLVRRAASVFNKDFEEAKVLLSQYERGDLDSGYSRKMSQVVEAAAAEWFNALRKLLSKMAETRRLPQNFYFCGPTGSLKEISSLVSGWEFAKFTVSSRPFSVGFLLPDSFGHYFDFPKGFSQTKDVFLLASALYASKYFD